MTDNINRLKPDIHPELVRIGVAELLRALERSDPEAFIATEMGPDNRQTAIDGTFDLEAVVTALAVVLLSMSRSESDIFWPPSTQEKTL